MKLEDAGKLVLRTALGVLILLHGIAKLRFGLGDVATSLERAGLPIAVGYLVYIGEVVAPLLVILGVTDKKAPAGFAPLAIGLALTLIHLVAIPVTGTSVNPARSTGPALFATTPALSQLWLFWVAPLVGATVAGIVYRWLGAS